MVQPFPEPGASIVVAYRELRVMEFGTAAQHDEVVVPGQLQRPWDLATCTDRWLRRQMWAWLDDVVIWLNREYVWDVGDSIVPCWPAHPDLVHELALLADRRYRAGMATSSDLLEEWHRYSLPSFTARTRARARAQVCDAVHLPRPSRAQLAEHLAPSSQQFRSERIDRDLQALPDREDDVWLDAHL